MMCMWCGKQDGHEPDCEQLAASVDLLNAHGVHINTRDESGVSQPLDAKTIIAIAELLVRAYEKTLVGPNGGPYVSASRRNGC